MKIPVSGFACLALGLFALDASAIAWRQKGFTATTTRGSIAASFTDTWAIGTDHFNSDGNQVYQVGQGGSGGGFGFRPRGAGAIQISVPSDSTFNQPWAIVAGDVAGQGAVKKWNGSSFETPVNGGGSCATSLAVGPVSSPATPTGKGYTWVVGCGVPDPYGNLPMYRYSPLDGWRLVNPAHINGAGVEIAVDASGTPYVINGLGFVYQGTLDVDGFPVWSYLGPGGGAYVSTLGSFAYLLGWNQHIFKWDGTQWFDLETAPNHPLFTQIAGGSEAAIWAVDSSGAVWSNQ
jgi:hypothetical protein